MINKTYKCTIKSGKHTRVEDGERVRYVQGDVIEVTKDEMTAFPDRFALYVPPVEENEDDEDEEDPNPDGLDDMDLEGLLKYAEENEIDLSEMSAKNKKKVSKVKAAIREALAKKKEDE